MKRRRKNVRPAPPSSRCPRRPDTTRRPRHACRQHRTLTATILRNVLSPRSAKRADLFPTRRPCSSQCSFRAAPCFQTASFRRKARGREQDHVILTGHTHTEHLIGPFPFILGHPGLQTSGGRKDEGRNPVIIITVDIHRFANYIIAHANAAAYVTVFERGKLRKSNDLRQLFANFISEPLPFFPGFEVPGKLQRTSHYLFLKPSYGVASFAGRFAFKKNRKVLVCIHRVPPHSRYQSGRQDAT